MCVALPLNLNKIEYVLMLLKQIKNETYVSELLQWFPTI